MLNGSWSYEEASKELDKIIEENEYKRNKSSYLVNNNHNNTSNLSNNKKEKNNKYTENDNEIVCSICGHIGHHHRHSPLHNSSLINDLKDDKDILRRSLPINNNNNNNNNSINNKKFSVDDSFLSTSYDSSFHNINNNRSYYRTPDSILVLESKHSGNNVIMAFRDLQNKAKAVEKERTSAIRVREELRQELAESKRSLELARNKQELRVNDHYLSLKSSTEELMVGHSRLHNAILSKTDELSKIQNLLLNQQAKQSLLESDKKKYKLEIMNANEKISTLRNEFIQSSQRVEKLEKNLNLDYSDAISTLHNQINSLMETIERDKRAIIKADTRLIAMEKYLEIILKVNGDLCEAITSQADAQNRIARLTEQQLIEESRLREREVQVLLENAETIGLNRALEVNRQVQQLIGPRIARSVSPPIKHLKNDDKEYYYHSSNKNPQQSDIKRRSISPSRYDKSVIEAAARMAATAAATSLVAAQSTAHCSVCPIKKFIPTGSKTNKEFNVVATVSKAAREAKNLNAKVASRVKSLDYNGTGSLYQNVDRVDLQDMHKYLRAVKKLQSSSSG